MSDMQAKRERESAARVMEHLGAQRDAALGALHRIRLVAGTPGPCEERLVEIDKLAADAERGRALGGDLAQA